MDAKDVPTPREAHGASNPILRLANMRHAKTSPNSCVLTTGGGCWLEPLRWDNGSYLGRFPDTAARPQIPDVRLEPSLGQVGLVGGRVDVRMRRTSGRIITIIRELFQMKVGTIQYNWII